MNNTADLTGGNLTAVLSQSISGANADNPLVAFYDIHERKREVLFFYFVLDATRDLHTRSYIHFEYIFTLHIFIVSYGVRDRIKDNPLPFFYGCLKGD
jgi:hypothetical protein